MFEALDRTLIDEITLVLMSIAASSFFSSTETAVTSMGDLKAKLAINEHGESAKILELWLNNSNKVLNTILVGNNIANILASVLASKIANEIFQQSSITITTGIMTLLILFFGEITPKTFAKNNAVKVAIFSLKILRFFYIIFYPITWSMDKLVTLLLKIIGGENSNRQQLTEDELEYLINVGEKEGVLEKNKGEMLTNIFDISNMMVREVMVPRIDIVAIPENIGKEELMAIIEDKEFSRIPVYKESIDDITGILYVKDIIKMHNKDYTIQDIMKLVREPLFVPETKKIDAMLKEFQKSRFHIAVVLDEYGGTAGIITMEDILEEIVGDIFDEYDEEVAELVKEADGVYYIDARMNIDDFCEEFGIHKTEDMSAYETLGGLVLDIAGQLPNEGDEFEWNQHRFTVKEMKDKRLERIEVKKLDKNEENKE